MESNNFFSYQAQYGCWTTVFRDAIAYIGCSTNIEIKPMTIEQMQIDKPIYVGVMARRNQLQPILDNPHLFDPAFVNAVRLASNYYDDTEIKDPE